MLIFPNKWELSSKELAVGETTVGETKMEKEEIRMKALQKAF